ncbi:hypothetical protein ACFS5L_44415 [Streptomyces phyllanthi]|uniref:Uncharacterized protein n=1 Tax=Streptomyces phyllanthi TaxID=1803180 RepID=A0A5N8WEZ0_9ACTN|nr:hypothetical protein [Streptomyces phyllanthi]MPY45682.1 hypothetical protein [Streptomyces phyllanthi]
MSREYEYLRVNRFGFAEYADMGELCGHLDISELTENLNRIVKLVLLDEPGILDSMSDAAQADFAVPLGLCARMLRGGDYSTMELISAACTVRYCAEPHMSEFPDELVSTLAQLPR